MKKHGWVIQMKKDWTCGPVLFRLYCGLRYPRSGSGQLKEAKVYKNRSVARIRAKYFERVCKVSLYKNGKAKKIIGRG